VRRQSSAVAAAAVSAVSAVSAVAAVEQRLAAAAAAQFINSVLFLDPFIRFIIIALLDSQLLHSMF
jgi:hypothetical protein